MALYQKTAPEVSVVLARFDKDFLVESCHGCITFDEEKIESK